ncbi:glycosyltransferase family 4 protein [Vibrio intestinalis]|uniref:glycosyltransferase family 4 protein n=1 Tax=Vibrio intestinalis TaxID=2933291 RepID=UPI0021A3265F|nr:glycosyltransferase family 4 protein [Vibrio intestinalis]
MSRISSNEIWLVMDSRQFGGIETHLLQLALGLVKHQQKVRVWLTHRYAVPSPLIAKLESHDIDYGYLNDNHSQPLFQLIKLVKQYQPQVVHCHGYKASLIGKLARCVTGMRQVSTYHAGETPTGRVKLYDFLDRYTAWLSTASIVVSQAIASKLPCQTHHFNNFIDTSEVAFQHGSQIAYVGRLSSEKAPHHFVQLAHDFPEHDFHLYGDGPLSDKLKQSSSPNLTFHGHQKEMAQVWPNIDVLIISSEFEGLPLVAIEAMARGINVISTAVGDIPNLIDSPFNGLLVKDGTQLKRALKEYLAFSPSSIMALRVNAANTIARHYSSTHVIPNMLSLYAISPFSDSQTDSQFEN